jgi:hypothetical protein
MHVLDSAWLGREKHCTRKSMLMMIHVHFTKSTFAEGKVHLFVGYLNAQFNVDYME